MRGWLDLEVTGLAAREREQRADTNELPGSFGTEGYITRINITRIHMEEDAGKLVHIGGTDGRIADSDYSLVDYNRCGTPLMELVTEPELRTPEEARLFLQKLRQIYLTLGISDCSMEEGSMRCDGNVSLRRRGETEFGTKAELKNMNSFKNLHDGLAYEICRQAAVLEEGGRVVQETRHWEPATKRTISMRLKETADDYRYFPDPNLAPYNLSDEFIESVRVRLPELPEGRRNRFMEAFGLSYADACMLAADLELSHFFDEGMSGIEREPGEETPREEASGVSKKASELAKPFANLLLNDVSAYLNTSDLELSQTKLTPAYLVELVQFVIQGTISSKQAKEVLARIVETGEAPGQVIEQEGMQQVSDVEALESIVAEILKQFPDKVADYRGGKTGLIGFFVGQAMKATQGQGNPKLINETFIRLLDSDATL